MRERGIIAKRPWEYFDELEAENPRKQVGVEKWMGPKCGPNPPEMIVEPVFEDDLAYLRRLDLLKPWEQKHGNEPI